MLNTIACGYGSRLARSLSSGARSRDPLAWPGRRLKLTRLLDFHAILHLLDPLAEPPGIAEILKVLASRQAKIPAQPVPKAVNPRKNP
jgi:hypothetical protein